MKKMSAVLAFFALQGFLPAAMATPQDYVIVMNRYSGNDFYRVDYRCYGEQTENSGKTGRSYDLASGSYVKCRGSIAYHVWGSEAGWANADSCNLDGFYLHVNIWGPGTNPHASCQSTSVGNSYDY